MSFLIEYFFRTESAILGAEAMSSPNRAGPTGDPVDQSQSELPVWVKGPGHSSGWAWHLVDLQEFEQKLNYKPIFTRKLLDTIKELREQARSNLYTDDRIYYPDLNGKDRIIAVGDVPESSCTYEIGTELLSYPELAPNFSPTGIWAPRSRLHEMNGGTKEHKAEHMPCPFFFTSREIPIEHTPEAVQEGRRSIDVAKSSWLQSKSRELFLMKFIQEAKLTRRIKKIVCFGFGALVTSQQQRRGSLAQHQTAFDIADSLEMLYQSLIPDFDSSIEIIMQDPEYSKTDMILLNEIGSHKVKFVADPDGLAEVDSNTLVIAPSLDITFPYYQIIADLFLNDPDGGPAGFLTEDMELTTDWRWYNMYMRGSPRVARMLQSYKRVTFEHHATDKEWEDTGSNGGWLSKMPLYLKS